ncbi:MAG TPA: MarR family transcriptional regulator, partial [Gallicola sp.]|nr:MarR family transcriptional regulator [Gallicola sp.]
MLCEVISKYFNNLDSYLNDEKSPRDYGSGQLLYQSEINFINAIYNNPESNAMELSK